MNSTQRNRLSDWASPTRWRVALIDEVVLRKRPIQIAGGFFVGIALGLNAWLTLQGMILFVLFATVRLNWLTTAGGLFMGSSFAFVAQPWFHSIGELVLTRTPNYFRLWAGLYHAPLLPYTRFHNTVCMGGIVFTVLLGIPATVALHFLIASRGKQMMAWFQQTATGEKLVESRAWRHYGKLRSFR